MRIIGTGTDIIEISRIEKAIARETFVRRVYTESERQYAKKKHNSTQTYAGIFAAKEACVKAMGGYIKDYEILHTDSGKPYASGKSIELSISHCREYATAFAVAYEP